jgi:hypothetical protein
MTYREPNFLPVVPILSCQQIVSFSQSSCVSPVQLTEGGGGEGRDGGGAESYDRKKAWASINRSIHSASNRFLPRHLMDGKKDKTPRVLGTDTNKKAKKIIKNMCEILRKKYRYLFH